MTWPAPAVRAGPDWTPPAPVSTVPITSEQRQAVLSREVARAVQSGAKVQSQDAYQAVLVYGKPVNHVLHLLLTVLLLGLWLVVWVLLALTGGEKRELLTVDEYGAVGRRRV